LLWRSSVLAIVRLRRLGLAQLVVSDPHELDDEQERLGDRGFRSRCRSATRSFIQVTLVFWILIGLEARRHSNFE